MKGYTMKLKGLLKRIVKKDADITRMVVVTAIIFFVMAAVRPELFMRKANFISMGYQIPELGFYSIAMMIAMLSGGIDLSIVSIGNLSCIICAFSMQGAVARQMQGAQLAGNIAVSIIYALLIGVACGFINGYLISYVKIPAMLTTMATSPIFTGIGFVLTKGKSVSDIPEAFQYYGNHSLLGIPYSLWLFIAAMLLTGFLLNRTRFGFELKFIGSNPLASKYAGMKNEKTIIKTYIYSGIMCSLCGLEILARTNTAKSDYAATYVFQCILCSVLGATNPNGGFAKISCLALALASLQFLSSGFNLLRLGGYFKDFAWGLLLLLVLSIDFLVKIIRKYERSKTL
jgi:simple sugar transport system permease protein